jgi:hypothetical protein
MRLVHEAGVSLVRGIRGAKGVFVCLSSRFYIGEGLQSWGSGMAWKQWSDASIVHDQSPRVRIEIDVPKPM